MTAVPSPSSALKVGARNCTTAVPGGAPTAVSRLAALFAGVASIRSLVTLAWLVIVPKAVGMTVIVTDAVEAGGDGAEVEGQRPVDRGDAPGGRDEGRGRRQDVGQHHVGGVDRGLTLVTVTV